MLHRRGFVGGLVATAAAATAEAQAPSAHYVGTLTLQPMDDGRMMRLVSPYAFVDRAQLSWPVPAKAVVDGASIPTVFWSLIGGPFEGKYRNASVIHDWFCAVRIRPWKDTHRMFYEAMLTSGVEPRKARLMFLAVRYAGPSWDDLTLENSRLLSDNGLRRLDPPGQRHVTNGFATEGQAASARSTLLNDFQKLAQDADQRDLSLSEMEKLIDAHGRAETTAAMLEPQTTR
jgi:hypothetical protein